MAALIDAKTVGSTFGNEERWVTVVYDFAKDTGAIADYDVLTAQDDIIITDFYAKVETAVTSADAILFDLGVDAGGTEIWSDVVKAALVIGKVVGPASNVKLHLKVPAASKIVMGIEAFAATAGKLHLNFKVKKY